MKFFISEISELPVRENFRKLKDFLKASVFTASPFKLVEITLTSTSDHFKFAHNLGYTPKDVILTSLVGGGAIVWNYSLFDAHSLDITVSGTVSASNPTVIRAFIGSYKEDTDA